MNTTPRLMALIVGMTLGVACNAAHAQTAIGGASMVPPHSATAVASLTDAEVSRQVYAYLSTIDTPIPSSAWGALGARAEPILLAVFDDRNNLPSRRAKAVDGLAALGNAETVGLFRATALADSEALVVRFAAVRGLGQVVAPEQLPATIKPVLQSANDSRIRALAAVVLVRRAGVASCVDVRGQVQSETSDKSGQFERALALCAGH